MATRVGDKEDKGAKAMAMATGVAGKQRHYNGDGNNQEGNCNGNKGGRQRAMAKAAIAMMTAKKMAMVSNRAMARVATAMATGTKRAMAWKRAMTGAAKDGNKGGG